MIKKDKKEVSAMSCPLCGKPTEQEFRPFCSRRCADIDLNRWLSGSYAIPVAEDEDEDGHSGPPIQPDEPQ